MRPSIHDLEEPDLDDGRRVERPLVFACIPGGIRSSADPLSGKDTRKKRTTHFRPASAFCSSVTAVRIVLPVNGPCEKDIGSPAGVAPTASGTC